MVEDVNCSKMIKSLLVTVRTILTHGDIGYLGDLFKSETVENFVSEYCNIVQQMIGRPESTFSECV
jgi:hypothetical protein